MIEIYPVNKIKVKTNNQLSEEHTINTESEKVALYHPHYSTFT